MVIEYKLCMFCFYICPFCLTYINVCKKLKTKSLWLVYLKTLHYQDPVLQQKVEPSNGGFCNMETLGMRLKIQNKKNTLEQEYHLRHELFN
jgi:hypothetical protein